MPIVTAYCHVKDGLGNPIKQPQVFLKVKGKMYRTHISLDDIGCYKSGWVAHTTLYRGYLSPEKYKELRELSESMLNQQDLEQFALDPTGLTHCGIRFVF